MFVSFVKLLYARQHAQQKCFNCGIYFSSYTRQENHTTIYNYREHAVQEISTHALWVSHTI